MLPAASPEIVAEMVDTVDTMLVPSKTRYPVTVPLEAPQDREIEDEVVPVTVGLPGAPGIWVPPPPQDWPLTVQLAGVPEPPLTRKPNDALPPGATLAL